MRNLLLKVSKYSTESTFYRRELPSHLTSLQSAKGKSFFENALKTGNAESFFALVGNFSTQSEPAYCGLSSLSMCLNALEIDPRKRWKGIWRWFSDDMLECAPENVKTHGMTFDQVHQVALCNGLDVVAKRGDQITFSEFTRDVDAVTNGTNKQLIVSFSRAALSQSGDGHFSPLGAISKADNQILVMDTARFKYPSYFVDSKLLFESMLPRDGSTGLPRGYFVVSRKGEEKTLPLCRITAKHGDIENLKQIFVKVGKRLKQDSHPTLIPAAVVESILNAIPKGHTHQFYTSFMEGEIHDLAGNQKAQAELKRDLQKDLDTLFIQTSNHPLYSIVSHILPSCQDNCDHSIHSNSYQGNQLATLFLLSIPRVLMQEFPDQATRAVLEWQDPELLKGLNVLDEEVSRMRQAWTTSVNSHCHEKSCCKIS